jgi:hypothetical protein
MEIRIARSRSNEVDATMSDPISPDWARVDPVYVEARRVLLDALYALAPHGDAVIVAGAQAVYLRTGDADIAVAPYTTDGDLAINPSLLSDAPALEAAMTAADFTLLTHEQGHVEPGVWIAYANANGQDIVIPVDLIVPEGAAGDGGRRGARLGSHGRRAARRAVGLEAALVDHSLMTITALDARDTRSVEAEVAGSAALLVAKAHKLHDRVERGRHDRLNDKDAADVVRIMQTTSAAQVGGTFLRLLEDEVAGQPSRDALSYIQELFGRRGYAGVVMASRSLRGGMPEDRIVTLCTAYTRQLRDSVRRRI